MVTKSTIGDKENGKVVGQTISDQTAYQTGLILTVFGYLLIAVSLITDCRPVIGLEKTTLGILLLVLLALLVWSFRGSRLPFVFLKGVTVVMAFILYVGDSGGMLFSLDGFLFIGLPILACLTFRHPSVGVFLKVKKGRTTTVVD